MPVKKSLALLIGLSISATVFADGFRQHAAHEHGHVIFNIAQDAKDLLVEITAPGIDVVGFEHIAKTDVEKKALAIKTDLLKKAALIMTINEGAQCSIQETSVKNTIEHHNNDKHHADKHSSHKHETEHKHHNKEKHHGHEHTDKHNEHHEHHEHQSNDNHHAQEKHHKHGHEHSEFNIEYRYHCDHIASLKKIDTHWFKNFSNTHKITVNLLTDKQQTSVDLTAENTQISLK